MSTHKFTAPRILMPDGSFASDTVVITDEKGKILALEPSHLHDAGDVYTSLFTLIPGMVNTHCHLELSHMKGLVDTGTTLLPFLKSVVKFRDFEDEVITQAIMEADQEMWNEGIVAVGDISNKTDTLSTKRASKIRYYTFVEMFDFLNPSMTRATIDQYQAVYQAFASGLGPGDRVSVVPHAPYTVSPDLFQHLKQHNPRGSVISIHNQETLAENELFIDGTGAFREFYRGFGIDLNAFQPNGKPSIYYAMEHMDREQSTLFVHNTLTTASDIEAANAWSPHVFWATCANANLYIENRLPNYRVFTSSGQTLTIGTDSLTSNWQLSVWEEIKTILKYNSWLPVGEVLTWATVNGAKALGMEDDLGKIAIGKSPGLVELPLQWQGDQAIVSEGRAKRLI